MYTLQDLLFSASLAVYVSACLIIAAVRRGHRCEPYARHMDYYYPAWKTFFYCFLSAILLAPAIFKSEDADAILQLRIYFVITSPFFSSVLMFSYFGKILKRTKWKKHVFSLAVFYGIILLATTVLVLVPGIQLKGPVFRLFFSVVGVFSLLFLWSYIVAFRMLARATRIFFEEHYSNPEDFPFRYAKTAIVISSLEIAISWTCSFLATQTALSVGLLMLTVINVSFLIGALSPHRAMDVKVLESQCEQEPCPEEEPVAVNPAVGQEEPEAAGELLSPEHKEEIIRAIRHYVEDEQAYLDRHLTLSSLSRGVGVNRTYVSTVMGESFGGFFYYVNRCRLAHAARMKQEQPDLPVGEIITASGFGSRQTYYNVRRQLEG